MTREIRFNVGGDPKNDRPYIVPDSPPGHGSISTTFEGPGRLLAMIPPECTGGATVYYQKGTKSFRVILPPVDSQFQNEAGLPPCLPPEYGGDSDRVALHYTWIISLAPLTVSGQWVRSGGQRFTLVEATFFAGYERFLREGPDALRPALAQLQSLGFNFVRTWLLNTSVHHLLPWEWLDFYASLPAYASLCAEYGLYPDFTVFTQTQSLMPDPGAQLAHLSQTFAALAAQACIISYVNENDQHDNAVSQAVINYAFPGGPFLVSRGSNGSDADTVLPFAQIGEYHIIGDEWQRKVGHNAMELADKHAGPIWTSEAQRADNDGQNIVHAFDAAAGAALLCAGSCCHTPEGKAAQPLSASAAWAGAWASGARSVDLSCQDGSYIHRSDREGGNIIRSYQRATPIVDIHS